MRKFELRKDGLMLALAIAMAISPAVAMQWADWVSGLWVLQTVALYSVLAGFFLAKSRFSTWTATFMGTVFGLFTIGLFSGLLLPPELPWHRKIPQLLVRQIIWMIKASNVILDPEAADTSRDGLIFIMHTSVLLWIFGFGISWSTFRRQRIWLAVLPSGILLLITVANYYGSKPLGLVLVLYLFLAVLYIVASHYISREEDWLRSRVVFNRGIQLDFMQIGLVIAMLALPVAWFVPNVSAGEGVKAITEPLEPRWQRIQDGWTQLFASLKSYGGEYADPYGNTLALGGPRQIEPKPIMDVNSIGGHYWRGTIYDTYTGEGWTNTAETTLLVPPDRPLQIAEYTRRQPITLTVTSYLPNSALLFFPHQPTATDRQAKFTVQDAEGLEYDLISALSRYVIYEGKSYRTTGSYSFASDEQLRIAGEDYPDWVEERYLQLPSDISPRVLELAAAVTAPHQTPYDKAEALTDWLRKNITYNELVEAPPVDVDPLEYLLFETKEGYCNYYASALAVMLRSQGIPARIAAGYTRGEWMEELEVHRVYTSNAHSWVEVFFPYFGWVEFEPTTAQPRLVRAVSREDEAEQDENDAGDEELLIDPDTSLSEENELLRELREENRRAGALDADTRSSNLNLIIGGVLLLLALAAGATLYLINRRGMEDVGLVAHLYDRMGRFGRWLGVRLVPTQTPFERATALAAAAPEAAAPIDVLTSLYVEERFGQVEEGQFDERANHAWNELWPTLLKSSFLHQLARFQRDEADKES
jgi:transglutaminase-like putative cysteine protease